MFKRILTGTLLLAFSAAIVGCEASAKVGDPDTTGNNGNASYQKKTTKTTDPNGNTSTKTEVHERNN